MPYINIKFTQGRSVEQKQEIVEIFTRELVRILDIKPEWVSIVFDEYSRENWATGGQLHSIKYGKGCGSEGVN